MRDEGKILYQQYFYVINCRDNNHNERLDNALRILLNSKEFTDTFIKISEKPHISKLLQLCVEPNNSNVFNCYFSGLYYVTDGEKSENRSFTGTITMKSRKIYLVMNIDRLGLSTDLVQCELGEIFIPDLENDCYQRFSSYSNQDVFFNETIDCEEFQSKISLFKEETIRLLRSPYEKR